MAQRHMDRLTSFDTSFLTNEKSQRAHGDRRRAGLRGRRRPAHEDFLASIRSRLHLLPRLRQRLAYPAARPGPPVLGRPPRLRRPRARAAASTLAAPGHRGAVPRGWSPRPSRRRSTARGRSGSSAWSRASRTTASGSSTRPTTRWPTGSRPSTSACCSSTSSRRPSPCRSRAALGAPAGALARASLLGQAAQGFVGMSRAPARWLWPPPARSPRQRRANAPPTASPGSGR